MGTTKNVGFIGLGVMGKPMCMNVIKAGFNVTVHNRSRAAVEEVARQGARAAGSAKEVAQNSEIVVTCLPSPMEVKQVILGENGIRDGMGNGGIVIDTTTVDPSTSRYVAIELEKRELRLVEAPISGGAMRAKDGTLTFMIGGNKDDVSRCWPILQVMGRSLFHVGPVGSGSAVKLVNQILCALNFVSVSEALAWGLKAGANLESLWEVIKTSVGNSVIFEHMVPEIMKGEFGPSFQTWLYRKDLGLVMEMASQFGTPMLFTSIAQQLFRRNEEIGNGRKDASSMVKVIEQITGVKISPT